MDLRFLLEVAYVGCLIEHPDEIPKQSDRENTFLPFEFLLTNLVEQCICSTGW